MSLRTWSTTAASNTLVEAISIAEGCAPGNLNDGIRTVMADVASWRALLEGAVTSAGTANAQTLVSGMSILSYGVPLMFAFKAGAGLTNTTAMTMAVDGLTALAVKRVDGSALIAGDVTAGGVYLLAYEASAQVFMLLNVTAPGVFVGDSGAGGTKGLVPAPAAGDAAAGKFVKADGTFAVPSGITPLNADVRVATDFSKTTDTTLANVTGLTATLSAGATYRFQALLPITAGASGGVKLALSGTCTATDLTATCGVPGSSAFIQAGVTALNTTVLGVTQLSARFMFILGGTITVNAGGTLTVQFAQNASDGTASTVHRGATFTVWQVT